MVYGGDGDTDGAIHVSFVSRQVQLMACGSIAMMTGAPSPGSNAQVIQTWECHCRQLFILLIFGIHHGALIVCMSYRQNASRGHVESQRQDMGDLTKG